MVVYAREECEEEERRKGREERAEIEVLLTERAAKVDLVNLAAVVAGRFVRERAVVVRRDLEPSERQASLVAILPLYLVVPSPTAASNSQARLSVPNHLLLVGAAADSVLAGVQSCCAVRADIGPER